MNRWLRDVLKRRRMDDLGNHCFSSCCSSITFVRPFRAQTEERVGEVAPPAPNRRALVKSRLSCTDARDACYPSVVVRDRVKFPAVVFNWMMPCVAI